MDYFEILGIGRKLALDPGILQATFYQRSREYHPDRFARATPEKQAWALEMTALLNDAWRTLRDPNQRAEYVLKAEGFDIGEQGSKNVPPELLEEVFELNMALEEGRLGDISAMLIPIDQERDRLFAEYDAGGGKKSLEALRGVLNRRRYIDNLIRAGRKEE